MGKKKPKFYVVWVGRTPGVYTTWDQCEKQISGFTAAKYMSFATRAEAEKAFNESPSRHWGSKSRSSDNSKTPVIDREDLSALGVDMTAWCVDAACKGNPGPMEYQGVDLATGTNLFRMGPYIDATVNVGEFLAIVHALALLNPDQPRNDGYRLTPVYSDSRTGISWIRNGRCRTKLPRTASNERLFQLIERAEKWLETHSFSNPILKWETERWGEIPADFGRK